MGNVVKTKFIISRIMFDLFRDTRDTKIRINAEKVKRPFLGGLRVFLQKLTPK